MTAAPLLLAALATLPPAVEVIRLDASRPSARVRPDAALGWSLDGGGSGSGAPLFDPRNRAAMRELTAHPVSYRLRTELAGEVWHWSRFGRWSDPARGEGYWTGDARRRDRSRFSWGYRLPRRGNSRDEANDDGFSRLDDDDVRTFWKSDPYLARPFIGHARERPEWIKLDLGDETPVDAAEVLWRDPFAHRLRVQYWAGPDAWNGGWRTFTGGDVHPRASGLLRMQLEPKPRRVRFVRLLLEDSSATAPAGAHDLRDSRGFAIAEVRVGERRGAGLVDHVVHAADGRRQSRMVVSSTDPWHRAGDRDPEVEQPSPLALRDVGLLHAGRLMLPVGLLYDTPEDALAELAYFRRFGLRPRTVELGEEPEGQRTDPEVYARLFARLAARLGPAQLGQARVVGPSLINHIAGTWLDDDPESSWTRRMLDALRREGAAARLSGFTLEHYPDDDLCTDAAVRLAREPDGMAGLFRRLRADGFPRAGGIALTEIGQSAFTGRSDVELDSALFLAEAAAGFLARGGSAAYAYSLTPGLPSPGRTPCAGDGDMMAWELDGEGRARWPMPTLQAFRLLARTWMQPGPAPTTLYGDARSGGRGPGEVLAYLARRPDRRWAVLLVNPGPTPRTVRLRLPTGGPSPRAPTERWTYSPAEYAWSPQLRRPLRDRPPTRSAGGTWDAPTTLPPTSLTVLRDR